MQTDPVQNVDWQNLQIYSSSLINLSQVWQGKSYSLICMEQGLHELFNYRLLSHIHHRFRALQYERINQKDRVPRFHVRRWLYCD